MAQVSGNSQAALHLGEEIFHRRAIIAADHQSVIPQDQQIRSGAN